MNDPQATPPPQAGYVQPQVVHPMYPSPPPPPPRAGRWLGWLLVLLFCGGLALMVALVVSAAGEFDSEQRLREKFVSGSKIATDKVAIITLEGAILDGEGFIKRQIDHVRDDEEVKAVVLRVDSPGGSVNASDYIYHHLKKLVAQREIPLVVSMGSMAASGGYYVSMAVGDVEDTIFAEPTTFTGSIGVIIPHFNAAGLMQDWKIENDSIVSHPLKDAGALTKPFSPEERAIFQTLVDEGFARFKEVVRYGRPKFAVDDEALTKIATGQIFTVKQALEAGLVDKEGYVEDAIDRAAKLANIDPNSMKVVKYKPQLGVFEEVLLGGQARASAGHELASLVELTTPRAYYLCTWLPGLLPPQR